MKSVESGAMVSLPTVLARVKSDLTVLSLHESGQLTDAVLASRLCELDLGCMVLENAGDVSFWNLARAGARRNAAACATQLKCMLQCSTRVLLWPSGRGVE